jgi:hypothetical protein
MARRREDYAKTLRELFEASGRQALRKALWKDPVRFAREMNDEFGRIEQRREAEKWMREAEERETES